MVERANVIWLDESDKDKTNVIYMLIFPNWRYYIGQTRQKLWIRIAKGHSIISDNPQTKKERAIKKYKTFHVMVLDNCKDLDELNVREQYWIELYDTFNSGYNSTTGGDSYEISDETRRKLSEANKNISDETRRKLSEANKGKIISNEHRERISESHRGKKHSDETRKKMSDAKKNMSDETRKKISASKNIKCKSIPDNIIFDSITKCIEYYRSIYNDFFIYSYLDNGKIHKKSGQTFVRIKD